MPQHTSSKPLFGWDVELLLMREKKIRHPHYRARHCSITNVTLSVEHGIWPSGMALFLFRTLLLLCAFCACTYVCVFSVKATHAGCSVGRNMRAFVFVPSVTTMTIPQTRACMLLQSNVNNEKRWQLRILHACCCE